VYENAKYVNSPITGQTICIQVLINGVMSFVPLDPANADYQRLTEGNVIIAPAPPPAPPPEGSTP
jgi:hypothetical protein